jgi:hypothetical protein
MSEVQHNLAAKLLQVLAKIAPPNEPITYKLAAEALGRDGKSNARMVAQVCDLLDAAAASAGVPLLALVAVQESSHRFNHRAFADKDTPSWLRDAIIEHSLHHKFTKRDFDAIALSLKNLAGLGNRTAWRKFSASMSRERRYSQLTGINADKISTMLGDDSFASEKAPRQYWALIADPNRYRIAEAIDTLQMDTWTSKGRPISAGDFAIIWQSRDRDGNRGIVALAQITESPRMRSDRGNPYWINSNEGAAESLRIGLRYIKITHPLWLASEHRNLLEKLSVARARGGTVFHVEATQWKDICSFIDDSEFDIEELKQRSDIKQTQREALIQARLGQGRFRRDLFSQWRGCAVLGCAISSVLRASHIKPWRKCSDQERLDPANGLLLVANLDALFNDGLITFADDGEMIASDRLATEERHVLRIQGRLLKKPSERQRVYLKYHRDNEFV